MSNVYEVLTGHVSPETTYVVDDYPYGFRLRCKIRYWLEYKASKGFRFCSQTTNPTAPTEQWNKPKTSTYSQFAVMILLPETVMNDKNIRQVSWHGDTYWGNNERFIEFMDHYGLYLPDGPKELATKIYNKIKEK